MERHAIKQRVSSRARFVGACAVWLALSSLICWGLSSLIDARQSNLRVMGKFDIFTSAGAAVLCDHIGNLEVTSILEAGKQFSPAPIARRALSFPGVQYRSYSFADQSSIWSLRISFLAPAVLFGALASVIAWRMKATTAAAIRCDKAEDHSSAGEIPAGDTRSGSRA
jgi:hypothetical protein